MMQWLYFLLIGAAAGWLATRLMQGRGFGMAGNMVVGVIGAVGSVMLLDAAGLGVSGLVARLVMATVGALVLLWSLGTVRRTH